MANPKMTFDEYVRISERLTADRLNNDACINLLEFVLRDISFDISATLKALRSNPNDYASIMQCKDMLDLLNSQYYDGITMGHGAEVADEYEQNMIDILGYDPYKVYSFGLILDEINRREKLDRMSSRTINVVVSTMDSVKNELKFLFPSGYPKTVCEEPKKHIYIISDYKFVACTNS